MRRRHVGGLKLRQKVGIFLFVVFCGGYVAYGATTINTLPGGTQILGNTVTGSGSGSNNEIIIDASGGIQTALIIGGDGNTGDAKNNIIEIKAGTVQDVFGGQSSATTSGVYVQGNKIILNGGDATGEVNSAYVPNTFIGTVSENQVTLNAGNVDWINGAKGRGALVKDNSVFIHGGHVDTVYAGYGRDQDLTNNRIQITAGKIDYQAIGATSGGNGNVIGNSVEMTGGVVIGPSVWINTHAAVAGGLVNSTISGTNGSALNNSVIISGGQADTVIGGEVSIGTSGGTNGEVKGNKVIMSGGQVIENPSFTDTGAVTGGSGWMSDGEISGNSVEMSGGEATYVYGGTVVSGNAPLKNNTVKITGGKVTKSVAGSNNTNITIGAYMGGNAITEGNEVTIGGSAEVKDVIGGLTQSDAAGATNSATKNIVNIEGSPKITGSVNGGWDDSTVTVNYDLFTGNTLNKKSSVTLSTVRNFEKINFAYTGAANITKLDVTPAITAPTASDPTGSVINTGSYDVEFAGQITGTGTVEKAGSGELLLTGTNNDYTGNTTVTAGTLALKGAITASNVKVNSGTTLTSYEGAKIGGSLDASGAALKFIGMSIRPDDTFLTVGGSVTLSGTTTYNIVLSAMTQQLTYGDKLILIDAGSIPIGVSTSTSGSYGVTLTYNFDVKTNGNQLWAILPPGGITTAPTTSSPTSPAPAIQVNEETIIFSEAYLAGISLLNQGADLLAESRIQNFSYDYEAFAIASGGSSRYNTGSHVDLKSFVVTAGITKGGETKKGGHYTAGVFFEHGTGIYDTFNSFTSASSIHGEGDLRYFGGGFLGRVDFKPADKGHSYVEGSIRAGRIKNKYDSRELKDFTGQIAKYSKGDLYYGMHLGAGYIRNISEKSELDLFVKYFYTKEKGDNITLSTGDIINLENVSSHRIKIGGRWTYLGGEKAKPYAGLSYQYEGDRRAEATTAGHKIKTPSLTGSTGIAELGVKLTPSPKWTLDIGIQGYVGEREGVTGSLRAKYVF